MLRPFLVFAMLSMLAGCTLLQPPSEPIQREPITSPDAPAAIGPYSQAIKIGNQMYCSGQIAINPATGDMIVGDIKDETRQVLKNLGAVLRAGSMDYKDVVKATVFLADMNDYKLVNEVYSEFFTDIKPAREAVQVARLPRDARVEISCMAVKVEEQ